jgi:predicted transcriptional regulator
MKYRSATDIAATILDVANGGSTKTKIMYRAYLSCAQLKDTFQYWSKTACLST